MLITELFRLYLGRLLFSPAIESDALVSDISIYLRCASLSFASITFYDVAPSYI